MGGGSGNKIEELAYKIKDDIKKKFDIDIYPEVNIL